MHRPTTSRDSPHNIHTRFPGRTRARHAIVALSGRTDAPPSLLAATSSGHTPTEGRVEPDTEMSLAAGTTIRAAGYREHGPARVQAAHAQQRAGSADSRRHGSAPLQI